jgi:hypothetical protein
VKAVLSNAKLGFSKPLEVFNTLLQKGHFSKIYEKEQELSTELNRHYYEKTIINSFTLPESKKQIPRKPQENGFSLNFSTSSLKVTKAWP